MRRTALRLSPARGRGQFIDMRVILRLVAVAALLSSSPVRAQSAAPFDRIAFDRADRRARALLSNIRCAQGVSMARARGEFGPTDSLGHVGQCTVVDGRAVGVFFDADSPYVAVR